MTTSDEITGFYIQCMECDMCKDSLIHKKAINKGYTPRGFYFESPQIRVLAVGKNPGSYQKGEEKLYMNKTGRKLLKAHRNLMKGLFKNLNTKKPSTKFHRNLSKYLEHFTDANGIFNQAAFTNLVKCSTLKEQEKLDRMPADLCFRKWFLKELELYKPRIVLALGIEVYTFLKNHEDELNIMPECLFNVPHPSWYYSKEKAKEIKDNIQRCI